MPRKLHSVDSYVSAFTALTPENVEELYDLVAEDVVRVFNTRGACLAGVALDSQMREDTVSLPTGAWFKPCPITGIELNGNPNVLTRDKGTSQLAQGPSAHTCLVQVERYQPSR